MLRRFLAGPQGGCLRGQGLGGLCDKVRMQRYHGLPSHGPLRQCLCCSHGLRLELLCPVQLCEDEHIRHVLRREVGAKKF